MGFIGDWWLLIMPIKLTSATRKHIKPASSSMSCFLVALLLFLCSTSTSDGHVTSASQVRIERHQSVVVVGTVYCHTCFHHGFSKFTHFISGASVAVECRDKKNSKHGFYKQVKTDNHGEFKVSLPFSVSKHMSKIKSCSVRLIKSTDKTCSLPFKSLTSPLRFKSTNQNTHVFSSPSFTLCKTRHPATFSANDQKDFTQTSYLPFLPKLPPLPQLPPLTKPSDQKVNRPGLIFPATPSFPGNPFQPPRILPPNPFQPPSPLIPLPPNPLQPSPPSFPNPFQPPPGNNPFLPFPPLPGLITPSPPPPSFPFFLPPFPFPPGIGIPPRSSSKITSP